MARTRYQRELDTAASPRFRRAFLKLNLFALFLGVCTAIGLLIWLLLTA